MHVYNLLLFKAQLLVHGFAAFKEAHIYCMIVEFLAWHVRVQGTMQRRYHIGRCGESNNSLQDGEGDYYDCPK